MDTPLDALLLARIQFAANITFHILFPTITIALAWVLLWFKLKFVKTGDESWMKAYRFWVKIFALSFAFGVTSGITMSFQFGTNWPGFMEKVGNIAGPLLGYEVLSAFFLEATFLGVMLFGEKRVSQKMHTIATLLVAFGTSLSAFWILVLNSWMQTPVGFEMINGQAHATDWLAIVFNPSLPYRLVHMMIASFLTVSFLIAGITAHRYLKNDRCTSLLPTLKLSLGLALVLAPIQILVGDLHGLNTLAYQPAKVAAIEAVWKTEKGAPLVLLGHPDEKAKETKFAVEIPKAASLILTHDANGEIKGLNEFEGKHPPVAPLFWAFRLMVLVGGLMLLFAAVGYWNIKKDNPKPWLLRGLLWMTFSGWIATVAGWYVTEIGRQPYLVYGVLTTAEAASKVPANYIGLSLGSYLLLYAILLSIYIWTVFYLARKANSNQPNQ
jgi:cytochrome d ubiquinol oxidase subunit I